jgi:tripartite-type tricarboxylate transporter receptor subunit TctC
MPAQRSFPALQTALAALALLPAAHGAPAADPWPIKPIRIIVPFSPGGGTDITARLVAQPLSEKLGQPVVIDHRPGAGTMLGTEIAAKAPADGYTLLLAAAPHAINPALYKQVKYDATRDFTAISMAIAFPYVVAAHPSIPVANIRELIAFAKANPGKLTYGTSGTGSTNHLAGELFTRMAGVELTHVPYKGGGPALSDALGGHVALLFGTVLETLPQTRNGKLRGLAVSSGTRAAVAPELPTVAESGVPGYDVTGWYAFLAPAGTPREVVKKLNEEITRILATPAVRERLLSLGAEPSPTTPEKANEFIGAELVRWEKLIKAARISAE